MCEFSSLQDEFPAQQNRELIRDNRELIPPYQAGTGNCLKIDPLTAMKHLFRVVGQVPPTTETCRASAPSEAAMVIDGWGRRREIATTGKARMQQRRASVSLLPAGSRRSSSGAMTPRSPCRQSDRRTESTRLASPIPLPPGLKSS